MTSPTELIIHLAEMLELVAISDDSQAVRAMRVQRLLADHNDAMQYAFDNPPEPATVLDEDSY